MCLVGTIGVLILSATAFSFMFLRIGLDVTLDPGTYQFNARDLLPSRIAVQMERGYSHPNRPSLPGAD
jgi:hypothetical protein